MIKTTVDVPNAGVVPRGDYSDILRKIIAEGHCPFCREHLFKHHTKPVLREGKHWLVTENFKPYDGVAHQFLIIALSHIERIGQLPVGAADEMIAHHRWLAETHNFSGSTIVWREGDTDMTGASVRHLHFQVIVGVRRTEITLPLTAVVGFKSSP